VSESTTPEGEGQAIEGQRAVRWVERSEELAPLVQGIGAGPFAMDTEADSFHSYREKVCLIQLSFSVTDVLVDPLTGMDLSSLAGPLEAPLVRTVLHGADYDIRLLERDCGLRVRGVFDTMIAARLVGERAFGLSALLEKFLGVRLDKRFQRADWSVRPLPPEMELYAVHDTRHLLELAGVLQERLGESGRTSWAEEEFRRVERVRWETQRDEADVWLRVKGLRSLPASRRGVLRAVARLRESTARRRDVPPFRVMRDEVLLELARISPRGRRQLEQLRGLGRGWRSGEAAGELLAVIEQALELKPADWPEVPPPAPRRPLSPGQEKLLRQLKTARDEIAERLGLEPSVVASRGVLERVVGALLEQRPIEEIEELRQWQRGVLEPAIERLTGRA